MRLRSSAMFAPVTAIALACAAPVHAAEPSADACFDASEAGQRQRERSEYRSARKSFAVCASAACPAVVSRDCVLWFEAVERDQPTIVISARDADGSDVIGASVTIDGTPIDDARGRPIPLDPGTRTIRIDAAGHASATTSLVVLAGEKNRVVVIPLAARKPPGTVAASSADGSSRSLWLPITLGAAAVTSFGISTFLGLGARSDLAEARRDPCATTHSCEAAEGRSIERRLLAADVFLGVGVATLGAALYFALRGAPVQGARGAF